MDSVAGLVVNARDVQTRPRRVEHHRIIYSIQVELRLVAGLRLVLYCNRTQTISVVGYITTRLFCEGHAKVTFVGATQTPTAYCWLT